MRLQPARREEEEPGQFWKDFIRDTGPVFRKPTIEQLEGFIQPTWQALVDGSKYVDDRLREIFDEVCARRDRGGQRGGLRGGGDRGPPVGPRRCPATRSSCPTRTCRRCSRATRRTTAPAGTSSARSTGGSTPTCTPTSTSSCGARLPAAARARVHPPLAVPEPVPVSRGGRLPALAAARPDVGAARLVRPHRGPTTSSCRRATGRSSTSASDRSARRTSS